MKFFRWCTTILLLLPLSTTSIACGDGLYRASSGVFQRFYTVPIAGNLIIYSTSEQAESLAKQLSQSGHGVQVVDSIENLQAVLGEGSYDVIIGAITHQDTIIPTTSAANIDFLPVVHNGEHAKSAASTFGQYIWPDKHEVKHYLKSIHKILKKRSANIASAAS